VVILLTAQAPSCEERVHDPAKPCKTREHDETACDEYLHQTRGLSCCMVLDKSALQQVGQLPRQLMPVLVRVLSGLDPTKGTESQTRH
jgi:hypothetical protein